MHLTTSSVGLGSGGGLVTTLTLTHSDIARIGIIEPHAMVFELPLPTRFIIRVLFLSFDSVEYRKLACFSFRGDSAKEKSRRLGMRFNYSSSYGRGCLGNGRST